MTTNTKYEEVLDVFHSMVLTKYEFPPLLEMQFFKNAKAEYDLEISTLTFDYELNEFSGEIPSYAIMTLGTMMYIGSLVRELSRVMKLNSITGRDVSITGNDATKRVTAAELASELERAKELLHKQKQHCFDN